MSVLDRTAGVLLAAAALAGLAWASDVPTRVHRSHGAILRLAWSARPERVESCRERTAEELSRLPQHMRQPLACEGSTAEYRLQVRVDGAVLADRVVRGGGLRRDRQLYVLEELPVPPGDTAVDIRFDRVEPAASAAAAAGQPAIADIRSAAARPQGEPVPPHLSLELRRRFSAREVILVTYSPESRTLVAVQNPGSDER
jgi:hypothetical protein